MFGAGSTDREIDRAEPLVGQASPLKFSAFDQQTYGCSSAFHDHNCIEFWLGEYR
jgi:hypothetical protein